MFNTYRNGRVLYIIIVVADCEPERRGPLLGPLIGHLFVDGATGDAGYISRLTMARLMRRFLRRMVAEGDHG